MRTILSVPRRERCHLFGNRALRLNQEQAAAAWRHLAEKLLDLSEADVPKFSDLMHAIREATLNGRKAGQGSNFGPELSPLQAKRLLASLEFEE